MKSKCCRIGTNAYGKWEQYFSSAGQEEICIFRFRYMKGYSVYGVNVHLKRNH